jgi:putative transposase
MARIRRSDLPSGYFHVTANSVAETMLFLDGAERDLFVSHLRRAVSRARLTLHAYCALGTHYHAVVSGTADALSRAFHWLNSHYAREANAGRGRRGALFAQRFSSWVIHDEDHFHNAIEYVLTNPVQAGLVERPEDWPWSGSPNPTPRPSRTLVRVRLHG